MLSGATRSAKKKWPIFLKSALRAGAPAHVHTYLHRYKSTIDCIDLAASLSLRLCLSLSDVFSRGYLIIHNLHAFCSRFVKRARQDHCLESSLALGALAVGLSRTMLLTLLSGSHALLLPAASPSLAGAAAATSVVQHPLPSMVDAERFAVDVYASPTTMTLAQFDAVDVYYSVLAVGAIAFFASKAVKGTIDEAKSYDERGAMANQMREEMKKRGRAEAREATKRNDPAFERLEAERKMREGRKEKWTQFDVPDWVPGSRDK